MKQRILLLLAGIFLFCATQTSAQSYQVLDKQGNDVTGTVITVWGDTASAMSVYLDLKNISGNTVYTRAKKIENNLLAGAKVSMCFANHCYLSNVYVTQYQDTILPGDTDKTFSGDYSANGNLGYSLVTFVFFRPSNPSDSAWVQVQFAATPVNIVSSGDPVFEISSPFPNPASSQVSFNYSIPENSSASFTLLDITGSKIKEIPVYNTHGILNIPTNDISEGMYFYSFYLDGKMIITKKLIIQK